MPDVALTQIDKDINDGLLRCYVLDRRLPET